MHTNDSNGGLSYIRGKWRGCMDLEKSYNYCIKLLSVKDRTSYEITEKLKQKNCTQEIIEETLAKLMDYGYINDAKYIRNWVREKSKQPGMSKRNIYYKLMQKGFKKDQINSIIEEVNIDDYDTALACGEKKLKSLKGDIRTVKNKLYTYLLSKGYDRDICNKVIRKLLDEDETYL